ncbi:carboxypeptidase B1-like [Neocloeon triangulifer]|uniref:carboxypeptidase B1-like n=1 Tax=Neocloeon triangulifer TaxID=2078957 RepID=UPI00286EFF63|nr:carboxypeptidase B1-like [Neocloeon triangulifer]
MRLLACFLSTIFVVSAYKSYDGYQVITSRTVTLRDLSEPRRLENDPEYIFWARPAVGRPLHVMTSQISIGKLWSELEHLNLAPSVYIEDVGPVLAKADEKRQKLMDIPLNRAVSFDRYMTLQEILDYTAEVVQNYPLHSSLLELGTTYEGNPLRAVKVSNGPGKRGIFLDAGTHAREHITHPLALKAIFELVENYDQNKALVDLFDWYILPVANPDGYNYTFNEDRFWRKNRSPNVGSDCVGTDPNRNYDINWGIDGDANPCSEAYRGVAAFSEAESSAIGSALRDIENNGGLALYMSTHCYGTFLIYPWGFTYEFPVTYDELAKAANLTATAIEAVNGTRFVIGSSANVYFPAVGASMDYAYAVGNNNTYSYTWELPAGGEFGFAPLPEDILPIVSETWEGIKALANYVNTQVLK